jgi:hypothetical protein
MAVPGKHKEQRKCKEREYKKRGSKSIRRIAEKQTCEKDSKGRNA